MKHTHGRRQLLASVLAAAWIVVAPVQAEAENRHYAVELFDHFGHLVATGRLALSLTPAEEPSTTDRIEGRYGFDRSEPGAPPLEKEDGRVHGTARGRWMHLSLRVFPLERVQIEARFLDEGRNHLSGEWRYSSCFWLTSGYVRAFAISR